jgi:hypothetical protein
MVVSLLKKLCAAVCPGVRSYARHNLHRAIGAPEGCVQPRPDGRKMPATKRRNQRVVPQVARYRHAHQLLRGSVSLLTSGIDDPGPIRSYGFRGFVIRSGDQGFGGRLVDRLSEDVKAAVAVRRKNDGCAIGHPSPGPIVALVECQTSWRFHTGSVGLKLPDIDIRLEICLKDGKASTVSTGFHAPDRSATPDPCLWRFAYAAAPHAVCAAACTSSQSAAQRSSKSSEPCSRSMSFLQASGSRSLRNA